MFIKKFVLLALTVIILLSASSCNTESVQGSAINIDYNEPTSSIGRSPTLTKKAFSSSTTKSFSSVDSATANSKSFSTTTTELSSVSTPQTKRSVPAVRRVLPVKNIQQMPELPSGCEIVCATMLLQYYGFDCNKTDLLKFMPIVEAPDSKGRWVTPWEAFVGNPRFNYYGCYYPVIEKTINNYFKDNNIRDFTVSGSFKTPLSDLLNEIDEGNPVIIWVSINMVNINTNRDSWIVQDGSTCNWTSNEHCVVLMGYDRVKDTLILSDPLDTRGTVEYSRQTVEKVYAQMYRQAVIIHKQIQNKPSP